MRKQIYRSSKTGKIVTEKFAKQNPDTTTKETLCDLRQELNTALNQAMICGKIKGIPSSNKISEFVDEYLNQK